MKSSRVQLLVLLFGFALFAAPRVAHAISLPDTSQCSSTTYGPCLQITNTNTNVTGSFAISGISGTNTLNGLATGVYGYSGLGMGVNGGSYSGDGVSGFSSNGGNGVSGSSGSGNGVFGYSNYGGVGVKGSSTTGNGVIGQNTRTDWGSAAITALAGADSGLAIWGTGSIIITGDAYKPGSSSWSLWSDVRIKKDVKGYSLGLAELLRVKPITYRYNGLGGTTDNGKEYVGVIAQELEKISPAMVSSVKLKLRAGDADETDIKTVDPSAFTYMLINAVKEQQELIAKQDARIAALERNRPPIASSLLFGGPSTGAALALLPIGFVVWRRKRSRQQG